MPDTTTNSDQYRLKSISELDQINVFNTTNAGVDPRNLDGSFGQSSAFIEVSYCPTQGSYSSKKADFVVFARAIADKLKSLDESLTALSSKVDELMRDFSGIAGTLNGSGEGSGEASQFDQDFINRLAGHFLPLNSSKGATVKTETSFTKNIHGTADHALWS